MMAKLFLKLSKYFGFYMIDKNQLQIWTARAWEHNKIGDSHDFFSRLSGLNNGRAESINSILKEIKDFNR